MATPSESDNLLGRRRQNDNLSRTRSINASLLTGGETKVGGKQSKTLCLSMYNIFLHVICCNGMNRNATLQSRYIVIDGGYRTNLSIEYYYRTILTILFHRLFSR